jgi:GTPase
MPRSKIQSIQMKEGSWYRLDSPEITECCACSLVHVTEYKIEKGRLLWRSRVDHRATRAKRRENGITILKQPPEDL